jgi:hypothetical protein
MIGDKSVEVPKAAPLTKAERGYQKQVKEQIAKAALDNDPEKVRALRKQLAEAARLGIISHEQRLDTAIPEIKPESKK